MKRGLEMDEQVILKNRLLGIEEAAAFLGLRPQTLNNRRSRNKGPSYVRLGRRAIRYRLCDLESYVAKRLVQIGDR